MKVMNGLVRTLEEDKRLYVFGCSIMWAILPICEWRCQDIGQVLLYEIIFFLSVFSSSEVLGKITSIWSKLPTAACWFREEMRGNCEANLLYVESNSDTTIWTPQAINHSQYSSPIEDPIEALNLIVEWKSQPIE